MTGPKATRNTGTDFKEQVDRLFRGEPEEEKEDPEEGDKEREDEC